MAGRASLRLPSNCRLAFVAFPWKNSSVSKLIMILASVALVALDALIGGRRLVFSLPCYGLLSIAAVATFFARNRGQIPQRLRWCLVASGVFFGYVLVRTLASPSEYLARTDLYMVLGAVLLYLLVVLHVNSSGRRLWLVAVLLALAGANVVVAAIQFAKTRDFMVFDFLQRGDYGTRASGFYTCPNHLAGFLETALLLGLSVACWSRCAVWIKILAGYAALMCGVGIMMSGSRGGYVSVFVGLIVFAGLSLFLAVRQHRKKLMLLLGIGLVIVGAVGFGVERMIDESLAIRARVHAVSAVDPSRVQYWQAAVKQFQLRPILGTGSATYLYYGRQFREPAVQTDPVYAHNDYLQFLAEYGLIGMAAFIAFLAIHLWTGWKAFFHAIAQRPAESHGSDGLTLKNPARRKRIEFRRSNTLALTIGALGSVAACMVHSFVDFNLHIPANTMVMAFVFGILASPGSAKASSPDEQSAGDASHLRHLRLALPALGLWMAWAAASKFPAEYNGERARTILCDGRFLDSDPDLRRAEAFAREAMRREKKNPDLHYYLAEVQFARAELAADPKERESLTAESVLSYKEAVKLAPLDANLYLWLGSALGALKKFEEAEESFQHALHLDPKSAQVQRYYAAHLQMWGKR